ncbi:hypothetical protein A2X44_02255 [candidate division CPR3 bacterium GWF2_35_18]|uniref:Uncharacterized protein n=1 Tax=candidate division CPR3 bacterium GW2011_GWF2_35_18 TaxID=1618350 RepID=A0A0G0BKI3_UNCC3|nr:MAG: hypothetical protein UR67_C0002G0134 [candidate division CPR3 bacterium GW2011_GWF2_35_18]KKP86264.1 MAG: hypothetical protein UR87_C0024G0008 [candidate division CPR3 bacterium GW2011_GWE2_35_7]OGB62819.1 MAG: hypothetical protein A2X44_02255 [candidate division CPR3 bacterium GWF2_35_18]OGB65400.1 MAG: hypothetical protein A2250_00470 [candidate division CPR3 bacterium RIFOXYA2_FULL_35_13]OGB76857.1 MAG: hypothetical protein A2476_04280 [candidate division CPR3 bacterium RIFOXYC2_FULL
MEDNQNQNTQPIIEKKSLINKKNVTFLLIIIGIISLVGLSKLFSAASNTLDDANVRRQQEEIQKEAEKDEFNRKRDLLRANLKEVLLQQDSIFTQFQMETISDYVSLELTVSDSWYYTEKYLQDRILDDAFQTYNLLAVKHGLRTEGDLAWPINIVDEYGVELAKKGRL